MSREKIAVGHEELKRFIHDVLVFTGASGEDADTVADGLVWANLRGVDGHGISRLPRYLKYIDSGEIDVKAQPELIVDRAATFFIDGHHGFGPVAGMRASALAVERAKQAGVCYGLIRETTHTGAVGRYAQWIAERDCVAVILAAGQTLMAYHGARVASLGTSPIAVAVPTSREPIVLDMATSTISNGKILLARSTNEQLPAGTVLTASGEATSDPRAAEILLPLGGAKGSGLSFMIEMLVSVLGAAPIQARVLGPEKRRRHTSNMAIIAIDVAAFRPADEFVGDADMLAALIKALPRQAGFDEILLPGERSGRTEAQRRKSGIPVPGKLWDELEALTKPQSIRMPERLPAR